jgi:formylglycine-generating enzyme required for sulfatase activity
MNRQTTAGRRGPSEITPWRGPIRGFSFAREVQPVLDRHCTRCHNGTPWTAEGQEARSIPDLRGDHTITNWTTQIAGNAGQAVGGKFSVAYAELHRFVRRPGIESDIHMLAPGEFHADTTELVQKLRQDHHGVKLEPEDWDRLITWIDLNAPFHGTWREIAGEQAVHRVADRARTMRKQFTGMDEDPEWIPPAACLSPAPPVTSALVTKPPPPPVRVDGWPFDAAEARRRQTAAGELAKTVDLGDGVRLELVRIPAGEFIMGSPTGKPGEQSPSKVTIARPFWMSRFEVANEQFARFDPGHDSHVETMHGYQFGIHGYPVNRPRQPVVRVSWNQAQAFCTWLSTKTGMRFNLPTEAQWEYACRAGTAAPFSFGSIDADFSPFANLGDIKLRDFALETYVQVRLISNPNRYDDWVPRDDRFNDGGFVSQEVGSYRPNAWGLHDMHGNVWEWTRSVMVPDDATSQANKPTRRVVRGGSWYDRPHRCTSSYRLSYPEYQPVFNVGFRVVVEDQ